MLLSWNKKLIDWLINKTQKKNISIQGSLCQIYSSQTYYTLSQHFPNCGSRPKSGSRSSVKWVVKAFLEIFIFCHLFVKCVKYCLPLTTVLGVLHWAAKLIKILTTRGHVTPTLRELHWLPMQARINVKMCLSMYRVHTNSSPSYVSSLVTISSFLQSKRPVRSSSQADFGAMQSLKKFRNRAFALAGAAEWI